MSLLFDRWQSIHSLVEGGRDHNEKAVRCKLDDETTDYGMPSYLRAIRGGRFGSH